MEIVIPPRDHGPSTYHYTWDENGEVTHITRVKEDAEAQERVRRGRQTVQWPFQSISTETEIPSPTTTTPYARRATWEPKRAVRARDGDTDSIAQDLIPDYVINFIRGETPETVARRKRNGGKLAERGVDITTHGHRPHQSRTADFEGFLHDGSSRSGVSSADGNDESRHILSSSREKAERGGGQRRFTVGWRAGVGLNLTLAFLIFLVGFVCLMVAMARGSMSGGESVFFSGSCTTASNINWGLHGAINLFTVALISGANYAFQVLSSPTRSEVSVAHQKKRWLDIGIPSVRNLSHIEGIRTCLAVILLVSAVSTQIIYNAVISTSQTAIDYKLVLVTQSFLSGAPFSNDTTNNGAMLSRIEILSLQGQAVRNELVNLTSTDCFEQFGGAFETTYSAALLVTNLDSDTTSLIQTTNIGPSPNRLIIPNGSASIANAITDLTLDKSSIRYCLAKPSPNAICSVSVNTPFLGAVAFLNLLTIASLSTMLFLLSKSFAPLATLGDAISSFLQDPDPTTRGSCLLSKTDVWQGRWGNNTATTTTTTTTTNPNENPSIAGAKYFVPQDHFWFSSPSLPRLVFVLFIWLLTAGLTAAALGISIVSDPNSHLSKFGAASGYSTLLFPTAIQSSPLGATLVACLPQVLLATLYLCVNSLLTVFFLSHESSLFAIKHHVLRVSGDAPEGEQVSSLYLTLPRPISWFLVILFAGMGFVVSQSVFVVPLRLSDGDISSSGSFTSEGDRLLGLGFSGVGLFIFLGMLILLAIVVTVLGLRRAPPAAFVNGEAMGNPMTLPSGSCSAIISSRCHQSTPALGRVSTSGLGSAGLWYGSGLLVESGGGFDDFPETLAEPWKKPVVWGVVREAVGMNVSHAAFTSGQAARLDCARSYA